MRLVGPLRIRVCLTNLNSVVTPYLQAVLTCGNVNPYLLELVVFFNTNWIFDFQVKSNFKCWIKVIKHNLCQSKCICMTLLSTNCHFATSATGPGPVYNQC